MMRPSAVQRGNSMGAGLVVYVVESVGEGTSVCLSSLSMAAFAQHAGSASRINSISACLMTHKKMITSKVNTNQLVFVHTVPLRELTY